MRPEVQTALEDFDGRHVAPLKSLAPSLTDPELKALAGMLPGPHEVAASWLLKARAEKKALSKAVAREGFTALGGLSEPDAILHLLQMAQYFPKEARVALPGIQKHLTSKRVLIRVWALDAFVRANPGAEAQALVNQALSDPSAAMRARARQLANPG